LHRATVDAAQATLDSQLSAGAAAAAAAEAARVARLAARADAAVEDEAARLVGREEATAAAQQVSFSRAP
jgi:hypothetical protein